MRQTCSARATATGCALFGLIAHARAMLRDASLIGMTVTGRQAALAARRDVGMIDGSSLLAVLVPRCIFACAARGERMPVAPSREKAAARLGARESMMLRPGPSYSPAAYFSADYDRYTTFALLKGARQRTGKEACRGAAGTRAA